MRFHPIVQEWFEHSFAHPTEAQQLAWQEIGAGGDVLISAPTGSGKTLAAFLSCLDRLVRSGLQSWIDDELAFHSSVTHSALDATLEGVGACRLRDKFNG